MKKYFKKRIVLLLVSAAILLGGYSYKDKMLAFNNDNKIDKILQTKEYSYLPKKALNYIKKVYEETGKIILTEKNKQENTTYLNPEYVEYLILNEEEKNNVNIIPKPTIVDYSMRNIQSSASIPSTYDLRDAEGKNYITPVRDQGNLGICWTFATAGAIESHLLKKSNSSYNKNSTLVSERQIDYITSKNGIKNYKSEYMSFIDRNLGDGGNIWISTIAIANGVSITNYNLFKEYNDHDLNKMELQEIINYNKSMYEADSTIIMPSLNLRESTMILTDEEKEKRDEYLNEVKRNIMENGASYVSTYMHQSCRYQDNNENTIIDVYNCNGSGGHAMEIIGWDDNYEYSYCNDAYTHKNNTNNCGNIVSGKGVWILKNSWGNDLQYPYLAYDSIRTGISFITELKEKNEKNWDNNYILGTEEDIESKTYSLNKTKIKGQEVIKKIKFIGDTSNTTYQVKIEKIGGGYEIISKKSELPGLITIDIPGNITVDNNTNIEIISDGEYVDKVSIFTTNIDKTPSINMNKYNNKIITNNNNILYSDTKNIPSDSIISYKLYTSNNQDVSNKLTISNNVIAENNINTLAVFSKELENGIYRIETIYNNNIIESTNIEIKKMEGNGTKEDPYIITTPMQLNQIRDDLDGYYVLGNDIDLTEATGDGGEISTESTVCPQGLGWKSINGFSGVLDGQGHSIKGLYQNNYITCNDEGRGIHYHDSQIGNGLFSYANGDVTIKNLIFEDFNIGCSNTSSSEKLCGIIISEYNSNDKNDNNTYDLNLENIIIRDGIIKNSYNSTSIAAFNSIVNDYGNIKINNIYLDYTIDTHNTIDSSYLFNHIQGFEDVDISNIQLMGIYNGKYDDGSGNGLLARTIFTPFNINNILSMVNTTNVGGQLFGDVWGGSGNNNNYIINGANMFKMPNKGIAYRFDAENNELITNINTFDSKTQLAEFVKPSNYSTWKNFNENWVMKTIDGVPRIPVLKFMNFEYTNIPNISIIQELNQKYTIYDYLTPKKEAAKRISFKSNDESIVELNEDGVIIPQKSGTTTIHVESFYDGYIKDVPINVEYVPNYKIYFEANGGTGEMDWYEVNANSDCILPMNTFEKEHYEFKEWNTKADGTGTSYSDLDTIKALPDGESITLYAQWIGEKLVVTFDPDGGTVTPDRKEVRYDGTYGELPIPTKDGYGFQGWSTSTIAIDYLTKKLHGLNLKANWKENAYTIVFDGNGGKINPETEYYNVLSESTISSLGSYNKDEELRKNDFIKPNYEFDSWNTKADGTGISYNEEEVINLSNVENSLLRLYAIWKPDKNSYDISLNGNNIVSDSFTVKLRINPLSDNANNLNSLIGNITYDNTKLQLVSYNTINNFNLNNNNNNTFTINSNTGINTESDILVLNFKNIGLNELEKTTITINELSANNGELSLTKNSISKEVIYSENGFIKGDMNNNGKIDLKDVILLIKKYLGTEEVTNNDITIGDMNNNNKLDLKDIILLIKDYLQV